MKVTVSVHPSFQNLTGVVPDLHNSHHHHYKWCPQEIIVISLLNPNVTTLSSTMLSSIFSYKANTRANVGE
jgi:hypothetical protein